MIRIFKHFGTLLETLLEHARLLFGSIDIYVLFLYNEYTSKPLNNLSQ